VHLTLRLPHGCSRDIASKARVKKSELETVYLVKRITKCWAYWQLFISLALSIKWSVFYDFKWLHGIFFLLWRCDPTRVMASSFLRFLDHTQRRNTVGRTPLDEWSARRKDLYLTTHNTHNRQTSMPWVGFEPTISAGERPQTYVLDRTATGTGDCMV